MREQEDNLDLGPDPTLLLVDDDEPFLRLSLIHI